MSRIFAGHHQVMCAVLGHNGNNYHLKEKKSTSFGVRRHFIENEEIGGVDDVIPVDIPEYKQSMAERFLARRTARQLKYLLPDIRQFGHEQMTLEMKE